MPLAPQGAHGEEAGAEREGREDQECEPQVRLPPAGAGDEALGVRMSQHEGVLAPLELGRTALEEPQKEALRGLPGVEALEERGRSLLFVTPSGRELAPKVSEWLEQNVPEGPRSLRFGLPGLDDVFLKITGHDIRDEVPA